MAPSSSSSSSITSSHNGRDAKLIVVLKSFAADWVYSLHMVDIATLERPPLNPSDKARPLPKHFMRLQRSQIDGYMSFFSYGSTVYALGSQKTGCPPQPFYLIETCDTKPQCNTLRKAPHSPTCYKLDPIVFGPFKSGKFYALSNTLASKDLEEFNPETGLWKPLPEPPVTRGNLAVRSHCALASHLYLITNGNILYVFDLVTYRWHHTHLACHPLEPLFLAGNGPPVFIRKFFYNVLYGELVCIRHTQRSWTTKSDDSEPCLVHWHFVRDPISHYLLPCGKRKLCIATPVRVNGQFYDDMRLYVTTCTLDSTGLSVDKEYRAVLHLDEIPDLFSFDNCFLMTSN